MMQSANSVSAPRYRGAILGLYDDVLLGWALDESMPAVRVMVEVYLDGAWVACARADQLQSAAPVGDGFHGFLVSLPRHWLESARILAARIANHEVWLAGTLRLTDRGGAETALPYSQVWYSGGLLVTGWVWDPRAPERHLAVGARLGDRPLARALADRPHPALVDLPWANHGFALELPWSLADGQTHEVHLESELGQPLVGSPIMVRHWPEGLSALLRRYWPAAARDPALALIMGLAADQDRRAPTTLGFAHYDRWRQLWRRDTLPPVTATTQPLGVLIITAGDPQARQRSADSLVTQTHPARFLATADAASCAAALAHLLAQGAVAVLPLWAGDRLAPEALHALMSALRTTAAAWVYCDCDRDGPENTRSDPWLKPCWDPDLFMGVDLISSGALFGAAVLRAALATARQAALGDAWPAVLAALVWVTEQQRLPVAHLPLALYWRQAGQPPCPTQAAVDPARARALAWLADQRVPGARISALAHFPALYRVHWPLPEPAPVVTLIIPTRDRVDLLRPCVQSVLERTDYPWLDIIVVDNDSSCPETLAYLDELRARGVRVLVDRRPFNYAALNNRAARLARGPILGLLNNDIEVLEPGWLREMVSQLLRPRVGAVGAKLLWKNGMVQHGGVVIGIKDDVAHTGNHWHDQDPGYLGLNQLARRQSAVTAACLLIRAGLYAQLGGLDETTFPILYNDVDFCLRLRAAGWHIVWTPFARLRHAESASRGKSRHPEQAARAAREHQRLLDRWREMGDDPFYHPGLNHDYGAAPYGGLHAVPPDYAPRVMVG